MYATHFICCMVESSFCRGFFILFAQITGNSQSNNNLGLCNVTKAKREKQTRFCRLALDQMTYAHTRTRIRTHRLNETRGLEIKVGTRKEKKRTKKKKQGEKENE